MELPRELRSLVNKSVALLGEIIRHELGDKGYQRIEKLRANMADIRDANSETTFSQLKKHYSELASLPKSEQHQIAHSFTLMLELMNACEHAYRSHRLTLRNRPKVPTGELPLAIVYVLTAHPTEARSPQNILVFHLLQNKLIEILDRAATQVDNPEAGYEIDFTKSEKEFLTHGLEIAWRTSIVRNRAPKVKDEAEHIYSLLFRDEVLFSLISKDDHSVPFYIRSWVGGDKDGHPGVDEKTLTQSLTLSRNKLLHVVIKELVSVRKTLELFSSPKLAKQITNLEKIAQKLKVLRVGDAKTVDSFKNSVLQLKTDYHKIIGAVHPCIIRLTQILHTFPGMVVPLELRESSDVLMSDPKKRKSLAIYKMLANIEKYSRGGDPRWYARGFIISMCESFEHIQTAAKFQKEIFKSVKISVIPLFENSKALTISDAIMTEMVNDKGFQKAAKDNWNNRVEMMVGYSDSSKEAGVLASRLAISEAIPRLEKVCEKAGLTPVFFHGSGGSTDRGGGSIEDQTAWWPKSALRLYKVTVQGEMIERSLATAAIAKRQVETIVDSAAKGLAKSFTPHKNNTVDEFAKKVSKKYRDSITSPEFLSVVEAATPYSYLSFLKIGSRPAKRTAQLTVSGLRAIPWVLCWTQTRVLFPTWWGVGTAWKDSTPAEKKSLAEAFKNDPVFTSYIKALAFTLAKIEINIWQMYLEESGLPKEQIKKSFQEFQTELDLTIKCYQEICGHKDLMWFRPWLGESIQLRSAMIHPLNLLQIVAKKTKDMHLLRVSVTGISSGMLTTG
ncbi:MAG: phosphoenolpyruvate carboxylase [Bdellovibrionota bacterium]